MVERDYQLPVLPANFDSLLMSRPLEGSLPWFEGVGGLIAGQRIVLRREETVIGRSQVCDVQFPDPKVSRQHAMVRLYRGRYFIQDMHSSRGTLVNSQPIKTHLLQDGDHVRIGDTVLIFHMPPRDPDQALEGEIVAQDS
jgi:pSer/pThr/pTyr-binding forkhead associated (FHA) protein